MLLNIFLLDHRLPYRHKMNGGLLFCLHNAAEFFSMIEKKKIPTDSAIAAYKKKKKGRISI